MNGTNIPTAKELNAISKAKQKQWLTDWLEIIRQGVVQTAEEGGTMYTVNNVTHTLEMEIRKIYEPLGYHIYGDYTISNDPVVHIKWEEV